MTSWIPPMSKRRKMNVPLFTSRECTPYKDLTNTTMDGSANIPHNQTDDPKRKSVQSWYDNVG